MSFRSAFPIVPPPRTLVPRVRPSRGEVGCYRKSSHTELASGFTLLELLLALAISGVLLTAVASTVHNYYVLRERGLSNIDRARSLAALSAAIRRDISAVRNTDRDIEIDDSAAFTSSVRQRLLHSDFEFACDAIALSGTTTTLVLGKLQLDSQSKQPAEHTAIVWTADIDKSKFPFLTHTGQVGRLPVPKSAKGPTSDYLGPVCRAHFRLASQPELIETAGFPGKLTGITFRYLGRSGWRDTWNSHSLGLPRAVEVTIQQSRGATITLNIAVAPSTQGGVL